ncbi:MAG: DUF5723 family protein [Bacteroidales bacterium]|nr:DUF5723 family protein [Bacteroidales bacterium]
MSSLYFLDKWSLNHRSNAAFAPENGYVSIPFMGSSQFAATSNLGLSSFIFPTENQNVTFMSQSVSNDDFLKGIAKNNFFSQESNNNFISFGFYGQNSGFWSFSMSLKEQFNMNLPYELFHLAKVGMNGGVNHYDLSNMYVKNTYFGEMSIGYSKDIDDQLRLGGKVKLLAGFVSTNISYSKFDVDLSEKEWRASAKGEFMLNSRTLSFDKDNKGYFDFNRSHFDLKEFKPSGYGISIDFGAEYKLDDRWKFGASFSDLGFMTWRRNSWQRGVTDAEFSFKGFSNIDLANIDLTSQIETLKSDAENLIRFKEEKGVDEYKLQELAATWNVSGEYNLFRNDKQEISLGTLWNNRYIENKLFTELLTAVTLKPFWWMTSSITYPILGNKPKVLGFALLFSPKWINVFLAAEGLNTKINRQFLPINPFYLSVQAGITIPLSTNVKYRSKVKTERL